MGTETVPIPEETLCSLGLETSILVLISLHNQNTCDVSEFLISPYYYVNVFFTNLKQQFTFVLL